MSITAIVSIIIAVLVISIIGSIIFTKKEQAAAEKRQKVASARFKADEAQDLHDGLQKAGLDKIAYKFLLERVLANLQDAHDVDPSAPGIARRISETQQQLAEVDGATYYIEMPGAMIELQGVIARLNKLIKYLVVLYQRRALSQSADEKLLPSLQRTLLKFDAEGHIKMGHQAANDYQIGTAKQSYLHAKNKLLEFGEDDAYVQQQLPIVEELLKQIAEKEGLEQMGVDSVSQQQENRVASELDTIDSEQRKEALQEQAELNKKNIADFEEKKKW